MGEINCVMKLLFVLAAASACIIVNGQVPLVYTKCVTCQCKIARLELWIKTNKSVMQTMVAASRMTGKLQPTVKHTHTIHAMQTMQTHNNQLPLAYRFAICVSSQSFDHSSNGWLTDLLLLSQSKFGPS